MIDFRYHLVSLISVFLALAVGIVLGAGPLKEAIGDQLTGQVESLRADKEKLRADLDEAAADLSQRDAFLDATAPSLVAGSIAGRRVAIVELDSARDETVAALSERVAAGGGKVTARVQLADTWTSEGQAKFRQSLAANLAQYLPESPDGSVDADLATALVLSLVQIDSSKPDAYSPDASVLQGLLAAGDLVTYAQPDAAPADMIVLLTSADEPKSDETPSSGTQAETTRLIHQELAAAAVSGSEAAVVVATGTSTALLDAIAEGETPISTVADAGTTTGQITTVLTLAAQASGTVGHYGPQSGATAVAPPVVRLAEVDRTARTAVAQEADGGAETQDGDADTGDGA
ncbi:copper transporter [Sanguibacter hominis ATCC BAA-789]|uniref:Copper transporter n=1 Tax=Sanguibacter hominis ATCC BAA-789 TaxID=1312740 RepID=A0A9X5FE52_9MICO|nr:copper transporter [Sanguibacter hominis ATCC BAA-789]